MAKRILRLAGLVRERDAAMQAGGDPRRAERTLVGRGRAVRVVAGTERAAPDRRRRYPDLRQHATYQALGGGWRCR